MAKHLIEGGLNADCDMHVANLILSYGSGLRENYRMKVPEGQPEGTPKIRTVVTEGGAFPDGKLIHDKVIKINKFFHYGQRLKQLNVIQ